MPNVELISKEASPFEDFRLNNGMIIVFHHSHCAKPKTLLVTSFRNSKTTSNPRWDDTATYCSLIDLETGNIYFEEPCSRKTTKSRLIAHLCKEGLAYNDGSDKRVYIYKDVTLAVKTGEPLA